MTDHITLRRAVVEQVLDALDSDNPDIQLRAAIELRCAFIRAMLAKPVQDPVPWKTFVLKAGITARWTDRERRVVVFALRRFVGEAYDLAGAAAEDKDGRWFKPHDVARFLADAKDAESALKKLSEPVQEPVQEPEQKPATGKDSLQVQTEIESAVAAEREACALVCEAVDEADTRYRYDYRRGVLDCAAAIRARGEPVQEPFDREAELDRIQRIADQPDLERCQLCGGPADHEAGRIMCSRCARA